MLRSELKLGLWLTLLLAAAQSSPAFSLLGPVGTINLGPDAAYQISSLGYNLTIVSEIPGTDQTLGTDLGAPKNLAQGYRFNIPFMYYAIDSSFSDYFGSNGVAAVGGAFTILNNLKPVSSYSASLSEVPFRSSSVNATAANLGLVDLKSDTLSLLVEQIGLAQPERWTYCMHDRFLPPGAVCPAYEYEVIQRNFDPIFQTYTTFVNFTALDFEVVELCGLNPNPLAPLLADAIEIATDTHATALYSAVASYSAAQNPGRFYNGLTRDDIGGLRYLYSTNRINSESIPTNSLMLLTNFQTGVVLTTSNLALLSAQATTNSPAALLALYPSLVINNFTNFFGVQFTTNFFAYFTNVPTAPAGAAVLVTGATVSSNVVLLYSYEFANVVTNHAYNQGFVTVQTTNVTATVKGPPGLLTTTLNTTTTLGNFINGDFYIVSNGLFGYYFPPNAVVTTTVVATTNVVIATNALTVTGLNGQSFIENIITYSTNYSYGVYPIELTNTVAAREGIDKINFIDKEYDSLINYFWEPVTNYYTLVAVTNATRTIQTIQRIVTQPDFVFYSQDLDSGPAAPPLSILATRTVPNFDTTQVLKGPTASPVESGPGIMSPQVQITFNQLYIGNVDDVTGGESTTQLFLAGAAAVGSTSFTSVGAWGSFDGSTNLPVVYPTNVSLINIVANFFFQITTALLPNASVSGNSAGNPYSYQLLAQGGGYNPPASTYVWSLAPTSPGLPTGMSLSSGGVLSGSPKIQGTYDFLVQVTCGANTTQKQLFILIGP